MRLFLILALLPAPALAWDFSPSPVCTLTHVAPAATIIVTKDLAKPVPYALSITRADPWPQSPSFFMTFDGQAPLRIGTDRHILSNGNRTLTVSDTGFSNVLAGLKFNAKARATSGQTTAAFPLTGAAQAVAAFEACPAAATS